MLRVRWSLYGIMLLGFCLVGGELGRAGQTSTLPVVAMPAELPPRTQPYEPEPELHAFFARAQRVSWTVGGLWGNGQAVQVQDPSSRVNGRDTHGQIQTPIPDSTYLTSPPFEVSGEEGLAGTLPYGEPATLVMWGKEASLGITLHVYVDLPPVARTADVSWEGAYLRYQSPRKLALTDEAVAWLPLPAGPWTTLPALYVDQDGDQQIDAVIEPKVVDYGTVSFPALQQVGLPAVLPPRENPTRIPVERYERFSFSAWRFVPPIHVSKATRVILQRRSGWLQGVDEQGRGWGTIPGPLYLWTGGHGNSHGPIDDPQEYALAEIQPMETGKVEVLMGPLYLVSPPSAFDEAQREAFLASNVLEIWYGPVAVTPASVLWMELPPIPWEHFPALYLDRDGDQVVDEVIEARIEIHPFQERRGRIDGVRQIL